MAHSRKLVCVVLCSLHAAAAFAPHAPAALAATRPRASAVPLHAAAAAFAPHAPAALAARGPRASALPLHAAALTATCPGASAVRVHASALVESIAAHVARAFERTLQPATVRWLTTTQAVLLLLALAKSAFGVEVHLADLFSSQKLVLRLSVGLCSVFFNKMLNTGRIGAFVVSQVVLAAFMVCTSSELPLIFTLHAVFERACLYTTALHVPALLKQVRRVADRVGLYVRSVRMYFRTYRAFA